jgi:hypothetical protein
MTELHLTSQTNTPDICAMQELEGSIRVGPVPVQLVPMDSGLR